MSHTEVSQRQPGAEGGVWLSRDFIRSQHLEGHAESQSHGGHHGRGTEGDGVGAGPEARWQRWEEAGGWAPAWRCVDVGEARERQEKGRGSCGRASPATRWWAARPQQDEEEAGGDAAGGGPRESSAAEETREWPAAGPPGSGTH